jgi:hypothetical protein
MMRNRLGNLMAPHGDLLCVAILGCHTRRWLRLFFEFLLDGKLLLHLEGDSVGIDFSKRSVGSHAGCPRLR